MFFPVSKILGFFANPSDLVVAIGVLGFALLAKRWTRAATWLIGACFLALVVLGLSPIGNMLMIPLEQRFPPWAAARGSPDGIVVLGGAISPDVSAARNEVALNEAAERLTVVADLARRFPKARILYSGGNGELIGDEREAPFALRLLETFGIAPERPAGGPLAQYHRERGLFQRSGTAEARRALVARDFGISHAPRSRRVQEGWLYGRALSRRLAHAGRSR